MCHCFHSPTGRMSSNVPTWGFQLRASWVKTDPEKAQGQTPVGSPKAPVLRGKRCRFTLVFLTRFDAKKCWKRKPRQAEKGDLTFFWMKLAQSGIRPDFFVGLLLCMTLHVNPAGHWTIWMVKQSGSSMFQSVRQIQFLVSPPTDRWNHGIMGDLWFPSLGRSTWERNAKKIQSLTSKATATTQRIFDALAWSLKRKTDVDINGWDSQQHSTFWGSLLYTEPLWGPKKLMVFHRHISCPAQQTIRGSHRSHWDRGDKRVAVEKQLVKLRVFSKKVFFSGLASAGTHRSWQWRPWSTSLGGLWNLGLALDPWTGGGALSVLATNGPGNPATKRTQNGIPELSCSIWIGIWTSQLAGHLSFCCSLRATSCSRLWTDKSTTKARACEFRSRFRSNIGKASWMQQEIIWPECEFHKNGVFWEASHRKLLMYHDITAFSTMRQSGRRPSRDGLNWVGGWTHLMILMFAILVGCFRSLPSLPPVCLLLQLVFWAPVASCHGLRRDTSVPRKLGKPQTTERPRSEFPVQSAG